MPTVKFIYYTGVSGDPFPNITPEIEGSWDEQGIYSEQWTSRSMEKVEVKDHQGDLCAIRYEAEIEIPSSEEGKEFHWGVQFLHEEGTIEWAIPTETNSLTPNQRYRSFMYDGAASIQAYHLTLCRYMGSNKYMKEDGQVISKFRVWAPNAKKVELVFGYVWEVNDTKQTPVTPEDSVNLEELAGGYIYNDGTGLHPNLPVLSMHLIEDGIWETATDDPQLQDLTFLNQSLYMYRVTRDDDSVVYRTDLYSRHQIGYGELNPEESDEDGAEYKREENRLSKLNGRVSCSVALDPDKILKSFIVDTWPEPLSEYVKAETFWANEFTPDKPLPSKLEDLIIYQLHVGALGFGHPGPGTLEDALNLLDYLEELNINAIQLLPISEFSGDALGWGYATSHYFAIEYSGGGRDQFKHFIRACHQRGIVVFMDMVYNHYDHHAERAQRFFDSPIPEKDIYYWYEGNHQDYKYLEPTWKESWPRGGYLSNLSTGDAPAYHQEMVRKFFISSAVALVRDFHIDGFRFDQTTSIHLYNQLRANGQAVTKANIFGAKFLKELGRTLRMFKKDVFLIAEDHSDWHLLTEPVKLLKNDPRQDDGMGFDAKWFSEFYHNLIGDTGRGTESANLIRSASLLQDHQGLAMKKFSHTLLATQQKKVVYAESHDEAGNSRGPIPDPSPSNNNDSTSQRTIVIAVNDHLDEPTARKYAEARSRFAYGITSLSAGTPMFLFGEEVGSEKRFKYGKVSEGKVDLFTLKNTTGKNLYSFYADINALRKQNSGLRSRNIEIVHAHDDNRLIVFLRWDDKQSFLVFASLSNHAFEHGYWVSHELIPNGTWKEVFNSDAAKYGGDGMGNSDNSIECQNHALNVLIPFASVMVLKLQD